MDQKYESRKTDVIYVDPVSVEDRPLPVHIRLIEEGKRALFIVKKAARRLAPRVKPALLLLLPLLPAALPLLLALLAAAFLMKKRSAASAAF